MLKSQLGKFADTPLGKAALRKVEGKALRLAEPMQGRGVEQAAGGWRRRSDA